MVIDTVLDPVAGPSAAAAVERAGFGGAWVTETVRDPFVVLARAADATHGIDLGTAVAIAFARSPMTLAQSAHDVHRLSGGRLLLGLGSQVKAHVTRRFGMPWSRPAARMREYVLALRAIWTAWETSGPLEVDGEFYRHILMTPFFDPGPTGYGTPPVFLGGVGAGMTTVAGEVADGFLCGPLTSADSLRELTLPALETGRARSSRPGFIVSGMPLLVTGVDGPTTDRVAAATRSRIAFYASTPAYRQVLEVHGWGGLHDRLHRLSTERRWDEMAGLIDDEVLDAFAVIAAPGDAAAALRKRWDGLADRVVVACAADPGADAWAAIAGDGRTG
jgi:probable F420-dependent oxidoreductase